MPEDAAAKRILVVEDDRDLREALAEILRDEGYVVSSAGQGEEALSVLRGEPEDVSLILLDLTMPVMNGWQFRDEQRKDQRLSKIPVVVLSAGDRLTEQLAPLGIREFVRKPIDLALLLRTIDRYCA